MNVCAKFRCAPLRIKTALWIFRELIAAITRRTTTTRVAFWDPPPGSSNSNLYSRCVVIQKRWATVRAKSYLTARSRTFSRAAVSRRMTSSNCTASSSASIRQAASTATRSCDPTPHGFRTPTAIYATDCSALTTKTTTASYRSASSSSVSTCPPTETRKTSCDGLSACTTSTAMEPCRARKSTKF